MDKILAILEEIHKLLAKSSLQGDQYQPISMKLLQVKMLLRELDDSSQPPESTSPAYACSNDEEKILDQIVETFPEEEIMKADGFDKAVIGIDQNTYRLIYSIRSMIDILTEESMSDEEAIEYLDFNVLCAYVGEKTPIYCYDLFH